MKTTANADDVYCALRETYVTANELPVGRPIALLMHPTKDRKN